MNNESFLESLINIDDVLDIIDSHFDKINKFAAFNINKRIHPSYVEKIKTLIPSLKPISLSSFTNVKPFPVSPSKVLLPEPIKSKVLLPEPIKSKVLLPEPTKSKVLLPGSSKSKVLLPGSSKSNIILPGSPKSNIILPNKNSLSKSNIILPRTPRTDIILPKTPIGDIVSPRLKTVSVTNLEPNIPKIDDFNGKLIKKGIIQSNKIELPQLSTIVRSEKSRPIVTYKEDSNIPKIPDVDDEHRKILLGIDFSKLNYSRHGPNNEVYDLPDVKDLAKILKLSSKDNKDDIIDRIRERAIILGFNIERLERLKK